MTDLQLQFTPSYIDILALKYPTLQVQAGGGYDNQGADDGKGRTYEELVVVSPGVLPAKETLDALITAGTIDRVWEAIKAERDRRTQGGGSKVGNNWFHSDQASRTQQIALVILSAGLPPNLMWKTMSGSFVLMNQQLAGQVFGAAVQLDQAVFYAAEVHRGRMSASGTPWSYDFSKGWPLTFEQFAAGITVAP